MGTIVEKSEYLTETKDKLKQAINNLGGDITSETTFREYAEELDNIYDNLPKTTGEGSNLSLTTLKGKMNIIPKGDTEQETTQGYNIVDTSNFVTTTKNGVTCTNNGDGTFTINGTATAATEFSLINGSDVVNWSAGTYKLLGQPSGDSGWDKYIMFFNNWDGINCYGGETKTLSSSTTKLGLIIRIGSGKTYNNLTFFPMITTNTSLTNADCEKYTGGTASPNPSYPQDIEVVTRTQEVKVENVNLIPFPYYDSDIDDRNGVKWTINNDGTINAVGTANASSSIFYLTNNESDIYLNAGTYKISSSFPGSQFNWQVIQIVNGNYGSVYWNDMVLTEKTRLRIRVIAKANTQINATNCYLQIEKGSVATPYTPHQEQTQIVELSSKNLIQSKMATTTQSGVTVTNNNNGTFTLSGTNTSSSSLTFRLDQSTYSGSDNLQNYKAGTYTLDLGTTNEKVGIRLRQNTSYTDIINVVVGQRLLSATIQDTTNAFIMLVIASGATFTTPITIKPMLVKGSYTAETIGDFVEYYNYELARIPSTNYVDKLYHAINGNPIYDSLTSEQKALLNYGSWYKKPLIGKVVLNGSENWEVQWVSPGYGYRLNIADIVTGVSLDDIPNILTNYYKTYSQNELAGNQNYGTTIRNGQKQIIIKNVDISTIADFKTWLSTHNVELYYQLATPQDILITNETLIEQLDNIEKLKSYNGTTNISSSGNLPMVLSVSALKGE